YSIIKADNTHFYVNTDRQFVKLEGRTPKLIGSPYDRTLQSLDEVTDCVGYHIIIRGHYLCVWTFPTEERTFVYDYKQDSWHEWSGWDGSEETRFNMDSHIFVPAWKKHLVGDFKNGNIYELTFDA